MELTEILNIVFGGTSVVAVVAWLYFRKENKRLKQNEVKVSDVDTQRQQMDLGEDYLKKVMELSEMNYKATLKNGTDNSEIIGEVKRIGKKVDDIEGYLNGDFQAYLKQKNAKPRPKPKKEDKS